MHWTAEFRLGFISHVIGAPPVMCVVGGFARMTDLPSTSGDVDAYEFFVEMALHFHCSDCGEHMDCPVSDSDVSAPQPPWATREGRRGMSLGWYVPPLTPDGAVRLTCFCPSCTQKRGLIVRRVDETVV
jgi:hypothetical protein